MDEIWLRAVESRDARFDGWIYLAVTSTGIYCRPSCPAMTPRRERMRFYRSAAAAQQAGYRACKRCRPDASPGSPEWNARGDVVGRAMRLIADGVVDREGVAGLARRVAYSERHVTRLLVDELGAPPLAIARQQRARTARVLIETTTLPFGRVSAAAGFHSVRQFNDTIRAIFAQTPTELRRRAPKPVAGRGTITLRLPYRRPYDSDWAFRFLAERAIAGVEAGTPVGYARSLVLPRGTGVVRLAPADGHVACSLELEDLRDLQAAVERCRRLLDLDADPVAVDAALGADPVLGSLVAARPGIRAPGAVDPHELAVRALLGQQVSVAAARTLAGRLVGRLGGRVEDDGTITRTFPSAAVIAASDPARLAMPESRARALTGLCACLADGGIDLGPGADRVAVRRALVALPGIGPWTAEYIAMRALGDPDAYPATDLGIRHALAARPGGRTAASERWRPWRSYAVHHLWASLTTTVD